MGHGGGYSVVDLRRMLCKIDDLRRQLSPQHHHLPSSGSPSSLSHIHPPPANSSEPSDPSISEEDLHEDSISHDVSNNNTIKKCPYCHQQKIMLRPQLKP